MEVFDAQKALLFVVSADKQMNCSSLLLEGVIEYKRQPFLSLYTIQLVEKYVQRIFKPLILVNFGMKVDCIVGKKLRSKLLQEILMRQEKNKRICRVQHIKVREASFKKTTRWCIQKYKGKTIPYNLFKIH